MSTKAMAFQYHSSVEISLGLWYCEDKHLWWKDGNVYDELSARHNGLIGMGAQLKDIIEKYNTREERLTDLLMRYSE